MTNIAFVCLGNICRSPMAEAVFAHTVKQAGLSDEIFTDSFGTSGFHIGSSPDPRTVAVCKKHNVPVSHSAQQISKSDFAKFDLVIGMDRANVQNLLRICPADQKHKVKMFGDYKGDAPFNAVVEDPYYGGDSGFETNFKQVTAFSENLLKTLK